MLQIRLKRGPSVESSGGPKSAPVDTVTVACPDHLVLADLPVAKSIGAATAASLVKNVGRRSHRQLGERVHFCVRCDFPIAIYGRLSPCNHIFCLDCARSDSICYLCDERVQKIQTIKMMEGLFVCAAPHCLKSFLKRAEFESHIHENHADLLNPNAEKEDGYESEAASTKLSAASESTARAPVRPAFPPSVNMLPDDKSRRQQPRDQPPPRPIVQLKPPGQLPFFGQAPNHQSESQIDNTRPPGFGGPGPHNPFLQPNFDSQGGVQQPSGQISDKQQGNISEYSMMHPNQPTNYPMPLNSTPGMTHPPFNYPPFPSDGSQPFYNAPYEMARTDSAPEMGPEQGSLLGFPPNQAGAVNFPGNYPWNMIAPGGPATGDGFMQISDAQGRAAYFQGDYGRSLGGFPPNVIPQPITSKGMESMQGGNPLDSRDNKGVLASQPLQLPQVLPQLSQHKRDQFHSGDMGRDGQGMGWPHENRDSFGSGQDS